MDNKEFNKNTYNENATNWEASASSKNYTHQYIEKPAMQKILRDIKNKKILCIGCGTGEEAHTLYEKGAKVTAFDISEELIKIARKKYPHIDFYVGDAENFSIEKKFDIAYASFVAHYFPSWDKLLQNTKKLLVNNGHFIFSIVHPIKRSLEVKFVNGKKLKLLGYQREILERMNYETFGDYLNNRTVETKFSEDFKVINFHSPISYQIEEVLKSGFSIVKMEEPKPIEKAREDFPDEYEIDCRIPVVLIYYLKKNQ